MDKMSQHFGGQPLPKEQGSPEYQEKHALALGSLKEVTEENRKLLLLLLRTLVSCFASCLSLAGAKNHTWRTL